MILMKRRRHGLAAEAETTAEDHEQRRARRAGLTITFVGALMATLALALPVAEGLEASSSERSAIRTSLSSSTGGKMVVGSDGDDEIFGGSSSDLLIGGRGDDFVNARDGKPDFVDCGSGQDTISIDQLDRVVAGGCEIVYEG